MESRIQRSQFSDSFALLLLAAGIVLINLVLHVFALKEAAIIEFFYPADVELPMATQWILDVSFLAIGSLAAVAVAAFAVAGRRRRWVQQHLVLLVSAGWFALGLYTAVAVLALALPMVTVTTQLGSP